VFALPDDTTLTPAERFALELLADLASVLRLDSSPDVVRVVVAGVAGEPSLAELRSRGWGLTVGEGVVTVERALLHFVLSITGAIGEQRTTVADRFDRVPATETAPVKGGFEREPVVSAAARALAAAVRSAAGRRPIRMIDPWPNGRRWAAALSHDLDVVQWWPAFTALRLTELLSRGELTRVTRVVASAASAIGRPVVWDAIDRLFRAEANQNIRSSWFVLSGSPTLATARAGDLTYRPESIDARRILTAVKKGGHEIGLHGSFVTSEDHGQFAAQRARLAKLTDTEVLGVRQHYLRMRAGTTPRGMAQAGFRYDSTCGFADRNGFRLGVADVVPLWDAERGVPVGVDEAPFTWMDRALSKYQRIEDPMAWIEDALVLADACRSVEGMWVGARLRSELRGREPYIAPIGELVAWRRARRALRATALTASGAPVLAGIPDGVHRFTIRDEDGREVRTISGG
jgi:hypothetical protein